MSEKTSITDQTKEIWNQLAAWWSNDIQEGDIFHRYLVFPNILQLANFSSEDCVLEIGCGNGALARITAKKVKKIMATDFSEIFINKAKERTNEKNISYQVIDATNDHQLVELNKEGMYDKIICSMVLHDMPTIEPFINALKFLLKPNGLFIFSIPHPCFNSGKIEIKFNNVHPSIERNTYINETSIKIKSKDNQPIEQLCFHRPLSVYFNQLFSAGLVLNGFVEATANHPDIPENFAWKKLSEISPAIISRWVFQTTTAQEGEN